MPVFLGHAETPRALAATARLIAVVGERARGDSAVTIFDHVGNKPKATAALSCAGRSVVAVDGGFVVGADDGLLRLVTDEGAVTVGPNLGSAVTALAAAGKHVVCALADGHVVVVVVVEAAGFSEVHRSRVTERRLRAAAINDTHIAVGGDDGVVTTFLRARLDDAPRKMVGHDGGVSALAFVRDGRVASGGDDGTLRLWYLTGAADAEVRGADKSGHDGGVRGLVFVSSGAAAVDGTTEDRLYSIGVDGSLKGWRLEDKKKPRTVDELGGQLTALCVVPKVEKGDKLTGAGTLFLSNVNGKVHRRTMTGPNDWASGEPLLNGYDKAKDALSGARARREEAVAWLAGLDDDAAISLLLETLANDKEAEVRVLVARGLGQRVPTSAPARLARAALKTALSDKDATVRLAAYDALAALEPGDVFAAPRAGLSSTAADRRIASLKKLATFQTGTDASVAAGLIGKRLVDSDPVVAATALGALLEVSADRQNALRMGIIRGNATVRFDALVRAAILGLHRDPALADLFARAFDDDDFATRDRAFALAVALRKPLARLQDDPTFARKLLDIGRRVAQVQAEIFDKTIEDSTASAALASLPKDGGEVRGDDDDRPLLLALASRLPDTAMRGAWALSAFGDTRALGATLQLSRHDDENFRRAAAALLAAWKNDDARTRLVWLLNDKSAHVRATAFDTFAAGENDPFVVADVGLRSAAEDIRVRALQTLLKAAGTSHTKDHRALLDEALDDESAKVRAEATKTALAWAGDDKATTLQRLRTARFKDTRLVAVAELDAILAPPKGSTTASVPWAEQQLLSTIADLDENVATAAYDALVKRRNPLDDNGVRESAVDDAAAHLAAFASIHGSVRASAARQVRRCRADDVRSALIKALLDDHAPTRSAAVDTLDALLPSEQGPMVTALGSNHYDVRVRAGELLAVRHDDVAVDAMKSIINNRDELVRLFGADGADALRRRAAASLATLGKPGLVRFFATELLKDAHPGIREEAARGLATATRRGDEQYLLDAIGHADVWVRSWAAEGLARLGDARCLPVLAGTLKHDHLPIRRGAVLAYAAFGADGHAGLLQGLDDDTLDLELLVFGIVLAYDLGLARRGEAPTVLAAALSAARPEVRFAAARALELRHQGVGEGSAYQAHLVSVLSPEKPEKPAELKTWPEAMRDDGNRSRLMLQLADALCADRPEQRYAAASALLHRADPKAFFKAAEDAVRLRSTSSPHTPDNRPRPASTVDDIAPVARVRGFLRRVFSSSSEPTTSTTSTTPAVSAEEAARLKQLAFGAYVGLLRQQTTGDDGQRVRRDAVERIVTLAAEGGAGLGREAAIPALMRALDDGQHLVRKAALGGLKKLFEKTSGGVDDALGLALMARAEDVARAALDELAERGVAAQVERAVNSPIAEVRKLAFETLERRAPKGSISHLVLALKSEHDDLRLSVLEQLSKKRDDASVGDALTSALDSEHKGLVLRAAEILAGRADHRALDALVGLTVGDDDKVISRARNALATLGSSGSRGAVAALLNIAADTAARDLPGLCAALATACDERTGKNGKGIAAHVDDSNAVLDALGKLTKHADAAVRTEAYDTGKTLVGKKKKRDDAKAARFFSIVCASPDAELRAKAVAELSASGKGSVADDAVVALFADREVDVRKAAVAAYAERCRKTDSPTGPLVDVVSRGSREVVLSAAEGLAWVKGPAVADLCLVPLLLVSRAAEEEADRATALVALGRLGDPRALPELELVADGGTAEVPSEKALQQAALEGLGRLHNQLTDAPARTRIFERLETAIDDSDDQVAWRAVRGLRAIGDERSKQLLVRGVHEDRNDTVIVEACEALAALGAVEAEAAIAECLSNWDDDIRGAATRALKKLFPDDKTRVALHVLDKSDDSDEQLEAANFLAAEGSVEALLPRLVTIDDRELRTRLRLGLIARDVVPATALVSVLSSTKASAVAEAAAIVAARKANAADRVVLADALVAAEQRLVDEPTVQNAVVAALVHIDTARAADLARARLDATTNATLRATLIEVLGAGGSSADLPRLVSRLRDSSLVCRAAAARAVAKLSSTPWQTAKAAVAFDPLRLSSMAPADANLLADDTTAVLGVQKLVGDAEAMIAATKQAATKATAVNALARVDDDSARERLSELARDTSIDAAARKAAYRSLRRQERMHAAHERRSHPDTALPSWSGRVGEHVSVKASVEVTK
jgi:ParB family chromosome partitioning protein